MAVLVTGGAGYIGSHMVAELCDAGEKAVVVDNLSTGFRWGVPDGVPFVVGDAGDEALMEEVLEAHKIAAIIHFAGSIVVPESVVDPLGYYRALHCSKRGHSGFLANRICREPESARN